MCGGHFPCPWLCVRVDMDLRERKSPVAARKGDCGSLQPDSSSHSLWSPLLPPGSQAGWAEQNA